MKMEITFLIISYVGYKNGEEALPTIAVVKEISPVAGDNTAHIQAAIDEVEALVTKHKWT